MKKLAKQILKATSDDNGKVIIDYDALSFGKELRAVIIDCHNGRMPCDDIYSVCYDFLQAVDEYEDINDDMVHEWSDNQVDIYTHGLLNWVPNNYQWVDEAASEYGQGTDFLGMIRQGQYYQANFVASRLLAFLEKQSEK